MKEPIDPEYNKCHDCGEEFDIYTRAKALSAEPAVCTCDNNMRPHPNCPAHNQEPAESKTEQLLAQAVAALEDAVQLIEHLGGNAKLQKRVLAAIKEQP